MVVRFTKKDRSTFPYWFAHYCAYNMVALNWGVWKWKYLFHDFEKPWLLLWYKFIKTDNPYKKVQQWHRAHNSHHIEYKGKKDYIGMLIDWEASQYTKQSSPRNAKEELFYEYQNGILSDNDFEALKQVAQKIGILEVM